MSIKYKIAFLFAVAVTLILSAVSIAVYYFSVKDNNDSFRTRLRNRALSTAGVIRQSDEKDLSVIRSLDTAAVASLHQKSIAIINDNGNVIYSYSDLAGDSLLLSQTMAGRAKEKREYFFNDGSKKVIAIYSTGAHTNLIIAIAANDVEGQVYLEQLRKILWVASLIAVIISFLTGLLFARNLIIPFKRITGEVNLITSNNLSQRIKTGSNNDELDKLQQPLTICSTGWMNHL
jgi:methyl-accepting chemotaxis protein